MSRAASQRGHRAGAGFTLIELLIVVAIIGIIAMIAVPNLLAAMSRARRNSLISDGRTLLTAFTAFNIDKGEYPPCCSPPAEALNKTTLFPLTAMGYLKTNGITGKLQGGSLTVYDSPDLPTANNDFYAVMTHRRDATLQLLVADTDEYPGHAGVNYHGVYLIQGATLIPAGDVNP